MLVEKYNELNKHSSNEKLEKYFNTKTFLRLKGKGMFCGMDYVSIKSMIPNEFYSRYDHSKNIANTALKLTDDFNIVLAGAFHDVGTLSFAHVNSFKKNNSLIQDSDELNIKNVIMQDHELLNYLNDDRINIEDIINPDRYPLIDKKIPALCLDRVDGILATCLFFAKTHTFDQIKKLYNMLSYFENLNGMNDYNSERLNNFNGEIVLIENENSAFEDFFKAINSYSRILLTKENRYLVEMLGLALRYYEDINLITEKDLFELSEKEIISKILDSKYKDVLKDILSLEKVSYAKPLDSGLVIISKPKIRQANPLCFSQMQICEIDEISGEFYHELNNIYEDICKTDKPIVGNLSKDTVKKL